MMRDYQEPKEGSRCVKGDLGMMRDFLLSLAALPASSSTSAVRYSRTAAR